MQRPVGVSVPQGQQQAAETQQTRGQPKQLLALSKLETYSVLYTDSNGAVHSGLCHCKDGVVYVHPTDERWAGGILKASDWLSKDVLDRIASHEQSIASERSPAKPVADVTPPKTHNSSTDKPMVNVLPPRIG
jgi:hypothetical protein